MPRNSKKDYEQAARICREVREGLVALGYTLPQQNDIVELIAARMAWRYAQDNPAFDSIRFAAACRLRPAP